MYAGLARPDGRPWLVWLLSWPPDYLLFHLLPRTTSKASPEDMPAMTHGRAEEGDALAGHRGVRSRPCVSLAPPRVNRKVPIGRHLAFASVHDLFPRVF
jgi:hypothetical protein